MSQDGDDVPLSDIFMDINCGAVLDSDNESDGAVSQTSSQLKRQKHAGIKDVMRETFKHIDVNPKFTDWEMQDMHQMITDIERVVFDHVNLQMNMAAHTMLFQDCTQLVGSFMNEDILKDTFRKYCSAFSLIQRFCEENDKMRDLNDSVSMNLSVETKMICNKLRETVTKSYLVCLNYIGLTNIASANNTSTDTNESIVYAANDPLQKLNDGQLLLKHLLNECLAMSYKKCDGAIYQQKFVDGKNTHFWERKFDFKDFVHHECSYEVSPEAWRLMTSSSGNVHLVEEQLDNGVNDCYLPILKRNRNVWTFANGVYDGFNDVFYRFDCDTIHNGSEKGVLHINELSTAVVSCRFFEDITFNYFPTLKGGFYDGAWKDIETPSYDQILNYQGFEDDVQRCVWSLAQGRMQYDMQQVENKQVICFLVGMAGTGKSAWIDSVKFMYEEQDVGVIGNTGQAIFCLDGMQDKFMWMCTEVTSKFNLDQAKFQQMVSGENVLIDRKHKLSASHRWSAPGMIAGNETPNYNDSGNSFARRAVAVRHERSIETESADTELPFRMRKEIGAAILKGNRAFRAMNTDFKKQSFWNFAPVYFKNTQATMKATTNQLVSFLHSGKIEFDKEYYIKESTFREKFYAYCKDNSLDTPAWTPDFYQGPLATKRIMRGKDNKGGYEKLAWPVTQDRVVDGEIHRDVPGPKVHSLYLHGCRVHEEFCDDDTMCESGASFY